MVNIFRTGMSALQLGQAELDSFRLILMAMSVKVADGMDSMRMKGVMQQVQVARRCLSRDREVAERVRTWQ
jgi:hypothetical protein